MPEIVLGALLQVAPNSKMFQVYSINEKFGFQKVFTKFNWLLNSGKKFMHKTKKKKRFSSSGKQKLKIQVKQIERKNCGLFYSFKPNFSFPNKAVRNLECKLGIK